VYDQNTRLVEQGLTPINLKSVMIGSLVATSLAPILIDMLACPGNGITDPFKIILSYYDMQCTPASVEPIFDIASCVAMKLTVIHFLLVIQCF
jgi:hypothetical protein